MEILQSITLDFARSTMPITVFAKQYDKDTRKIEITPLNNGSPYTLETGVTPRLQMTKPDKTTVINNATIGSGANAGKITVTLTAQCLTAAGTAVAEIGLYKGATLLSSQTFYIDVQRGAYDEDAPESSDEYNALVEALNAAETATAEAGAATTAANAATAAANAAAGRAENAVATANTAIANANTAVANANAALAEAHEITGNLQSLLEEVHYGHVIE